MTRLGYLARVDRRSGVTREALFVITDRYGSDLFPDNLSASDSARLIELLKRPTVGGFDAVRMARNTPSFRLAKMIEEFFLSRRGRGDLLVLYIKGCLFRDNTGALRFATVDTRQDRLQSSSLSGAFLEEKMNGSRSDNQVLLLDTVFCTISKNTPVFSLHLTTEIGSTLAGQKNQRVVLAAPDALRVVSMKEEALCAEAASPEPSFTEVIIDGIQSGAADTDHTGKITVANLFEHLFDRAVNEDRSPPHRWPPNAGEGMVLAKHPRVSHFEVFSATEQTNKADTWMINEDERGALTDVPVTSRAADLFGRHPYIESLADIIDNSTTQTPLVIALDTADGSGRTSIGHMLYEELHRLRAGFHPVGGRHILCWFDASCHKEAPHLSSVLLASLLTSLQASRSLQHRVQHPTSADFVCANWWQQRAWIGSAVLTSLATGAFFFPALASALGGAALVGACGTWTAHLYGTRSPLGTFLRDPQRCARLGAVPAARAQLGRLVAHTTAEAGGRVVLLLDNLDQCPPCAVAEVHTALEQLLNHPEVVIVLLGGEESIGSNFVSSHTHTREDREEKREAKIRQQRIERTVQLRVVLPAPHHTQIRSLLLSAVMPEKRAFSLGELDGLPGESTPEGTAPEECPLVDDHLTESAAAAARRRMQRRAHVQEALVPAFRAAAPWAGPRPRDSLHLANRLILSLSIAAGTGLLDREDVTPEHIGKWTVLAQRWPELAVLVTRDPACLAEIESRMLATLAATEKRQPENSGGRDKENTELALFLATPPGLSPVAFILTQTLPPAAAALQERGKIELDVSEHTPREQSPPITQRPAQNDRVVLPEKPCNNAHTPLI